ncbi:Hypothetical protein FKW44_014085, partial [Caligus rogercresseyi]
TKQFNLHYKYKIFNSSKNYDECLRIRRRPKILMIGATARYAALSIKITDLGAPTWNWVGDIIEYVQQDRSSK